MATLGTARAVPPATDHFQRTWARTDKPVADITASRTWMWGPEAFTGALDEDYAEAPDQLRLVQYFDKSRMEDNSWRTTTPPWDVTNGLLVVEMMTGQLQVGDTGFHPRQPARVNVGGDADDPTGPTYATMAMVRDAPPLPDDEIIAWTIDRDGNVGQPVPQLANFGVTAAHRVTVPNLDHQVASVFWDFMNSSGPVWENDQLVTDQLFLNPYYATGYPITEAYWAEIKVANTYKMVLLQCFERRCLTYTPDNPPGWQVEAGNVGQHYYAWRYGQQQPEPTATATATGTTTPTATATSSPTATATATASPTASPTATQPMPPAAPPYQFSTTLGEPWDPATLVNSPQGVAIGGGDIYVADTANHRIQKYGYDGVFHLQWGSQGTATASSTTLSESPSTSIGAVYVADRGNGRIQIFDSAGNWLQTVTTVDPGGQILHTLQSPADVAIGGGYVWVSRCGKATTPGLPDLRKHR
ncbi:MAG: NHL repeat-containing protein [Thermomicrobiales bacterium]